MSTDLLEAAAKGDVDAVREALAAGADVNAVNSRGSTALMLASHSGHEDVLRELLKHDPDLAPRAADGWRALTSAAANTFSRPDGSRTQALRLLLEAGDRPRPGREDWKALHYAAEWGNAESVELLLACGMDPDVRDDDGRTALMRAARKSCVSGVRALIAGGADVNAADSDGATALMYAARRANLEQVQALLDAGAKVDATDAGGRTAHAIAVEAKKAKVAALLAPNR